jgi:hypothetical protein
MPQLSVLEDDHVDRVRPVFKLGPPAGLLFTPKAIYESGDPWWNEVDRGKLLTRPSELSGNFTRRDIW